MVFHGCICSRAIHAARQVTYSLKAAGERRRRARPAQGVAPALAGWQLDTLAAIAGCLRQAGLSSSYSLCQTIVCLCKKLTDCSGHCLRRTKKLHTSM